MPTHEVLNQPPPLERYDVFGADAALREGVQREGAGWAAGDLTVLGSMAGDPDSMEWGREANANPPTLRTHDRYGNRVDRVDFHPTYHRLMDVAVTFGLHAAPWAHEQAGGHVARAAKFAVWSQVEQGHGCPISMTYSVVPALRQQKELAEEWEPMLTSARYDSSDRPAPAKAGALAGMAMTEKQGGSDVRANTTRAEPAAGGRTGPGAQYVLTGHKWFCSAPMCDLFLMLAQAPGGLSCFAVPRWLPDGTKNPIHLQRLKDKLGNRSNASSEIELDGTTGWMVGEEGRGVPTIINMVNHTRLDCVIGATATMRQALVQAIHHTTHRAAFGKRLVEQPLMANVLADLAVESEAATVTMLRLARAYDADPAHDEEAAFRRIATAVAKYWICKRQTTFVAEALECFGGNGYVEDSGMPRLFRESPLNGIWEGSGNVMCLDVLRAMVRDPRTIDRLRDEVTAATGGDDKLDSFAQETFAQLSALAADDGQSGAIEAGARRLVERLALCLQGSLLVRHGDPAIASAFCATRLGGDWGHAFGTLPRGVDTTAIITRAWAPAA